MGGMDAVLLVSFGGPESSDEVMPFLRQVTAGRDVPEERLLEVAEHYFDRDGVSPINAQNRVLRQALADALAPDGLEVFWGNRNSEPWLADTFVQMKEAGVTRVIAVFTSAYSSYSGCRQYRENLAAANDGVGLDVIKVPGYFNHPGFVQANLERLLVTLEQAPADSTVVFTTHSIPVSMAAGSGPAGGGYESQHRALANHLMEAVAERTGRRHPWELVYQSRSGPPQIPWLEPDVNDYLETLKASGVESVVVAPIGFVSDHMEVVQDLDTEAAETAERLGLTFHRVPTVGDDPVFVDGLAEAVRAVRAGMTMPVEFDEPLPTPCAHGCCPNARRPQTPACCEALA